MNEIIHDNKLVAFTEGLRPSLLPLSPAVLKRAEETLDSCDFPTTRNEAWKYTRVGRIANLKPSNSIQGTLHLDQKFLISKNAITLVFENGNFLKEHSSNDLPVGLHISSLAECSESDLGLLGKNLNLENEVFNSLNTRYMNNGAFIRVAAKTKIEKPIQLIHVLSGSDQIANIRHYIHLEKFAEATIIEGFFTANSVASFTNIVTEIQVDESAHLSIDKIQYENEGNFHVSTEQVAQEKDSTFSINTLTLDGTLVRNNLNIEVNGENCNTHLNGTYLLKDNQHVDNHTIVDHKAPHCESNELYKGVIDDKATAVFNGKVFVRKDSQKINAFQSNANVLLSDNATINSKPELEIYADDVKCSHGSTTGQLDEEAVFYLRARGISEKSARHLMVAAFIEDVIQKIESKEVIDFSHGIIKDRFGWEF
jgi:Fe-S cluster assembly protein SufD